MDESRRPPRPTPGDGRGASRSRRGSGAADGRRPARPAGPSRPGRADRSDRPGRPDRAARRRLLRVVPDEAAGPDTRPIGAAEAPSPPTGGGRAARPARPAGPARPGRPRGVDRRALLADATQPLDAVDVPAERTSVEDQPVRILAAVPDPDPAPDTASRAERSATSARRRPRRGGGRPPPPRPPPGGGGGAPPGGPRRKERRARAREAVRLAKAGGEYRSDRRVVIGVACVAVLSMVALLIVAQPMRLWQQQRRDIAEAQESVDEIRAQRRRVQEQTERMNTDAAVREHARSLFEMSDEGKPIAFIPPTAAVDLGLPETWPFTGIERELGAG